MKTRVCFITALFMTCMALIGGAYAGEASQSDSDNGAEAIVWAYMLAEPDAAAILQSGPIQEGLVTWMLTTSSDTANACLTEALARKLGLPVIDSFSDTGESAIMIAKMEALTKEQLRVLQGLHLYIKEVVANRNQQADDADTPKADTGESQLTSEQAADFANAFRDQGLTTTSISDETTGAPETISAAANEQESRSEEEIVELSDFLMSRFSQYDEAQLQELQSWFLALPAADHAAIVRYLAKHLSSADLDAFFSWYEVALTSCPGSTNAGADSLRIPGDKTWADLTFADFPAPSQGAISRTTEMKIGNGNGSPGCAGKRQAGNG